MFDNTSLSLCIRYYQGGNYVITVLDSYGTSLSLLFIVFVETASVCWIFGVKRFSDKLEEMYGQRPGIYWRICWTYISPTLLLVIFLAAIYQETDRYTSLVLDEYSFPKWAMGLGWLMTASSLVCIPIYAIYLLAKTPGTFSQVKVSYLFSVISLKITTTNFRQQGN